MKNTIISVFILSLSLLFSCSEDEIQTFDSKSSLYVIDYIKDANDKSIRVDTVDVSFSQLGAATTYTQDFYIGLIGNIGKTDLEYSVKVVKDLTTATSEQYELPEKLIFKKDVSRDILPITIFKDKLAVDEEVVLTIELVDNDNFDLGYKGERTIKFWFNNKVVKPKWWTNSVELAYFGEYSLEKLNLIMSLNPEFKTIEGLSLVEIREIALKTKKYIQDNGLDMEIPMN